jgi:hypothetical protein
MIIALFIIAAVVSMPIAATVVVSIASRREDAAWSLGQPPQGMVQATARRVLDFSTECPALQLPKNCSPARPAVPARLMAQDSVGQPAPSTVTDTPRSAAASTVSIGTAA